MTHVTKVRHDHKTNILIKRMHNVEEYHTSFTFVIASCLADDTYMTIKQRLFTKAAVQLGVLQTSSFELSNYS